MGGILKPLKPSKYGWFMTLLAASINQHQTFLADGHSDYGYSPGALVPGELMATNEVNWVDFQTAKLTLSWWHLGQQGIAGLPVTSCHQLHSKWPGPYFSIWVWVNTYRYIFSGMNIHLPDIWGSLGTRVLTHPHISQDFLGLGQWFQFKGLPQKRPILSKSGQCFQRLLQNVTKCYQLMSSYTSWWFGTFLFFHILGIILPTD